MSNTPSETEIDNLLCKHWPAYSMQAVLVKMWLREVAATTLRIFNGQQQRQIEPSATSKKTSSLNSVSMPQHGLVAAYSTKLLLNQ